MWLFVNNQPCFGYIQITTLNNKNKFGAPYIFIINYYCFDGARESRIYCLDLKP